MKQKGAAMKAEQVQSEASWRSLTITIPAVEDRVPTFSFIGEWTGKDITLVSRLLNREYTRAKRDERRRLNGGKNG